MAAACVVHLTASIILFPGWFFAKYPEASELWRAGTFGPAQGSDYSPLYLLLNAALPPLALRWVQGVLSLVAIAAVFLIGRRCLGPLAGIVAAWVCALAAPLFLYEATLEPDHLIAVLGAVALAALLSAQGPRSFGLLVAAGAAVGLSAALRPTALLFLLFAAGWWIVHARRSGSHGRTVALGLVAMGAAAWFCAAVPVSLVRARTPTEVGATMSAGAVLHMGNRPEGTGIGAQPPRLIKFVEMQTVRNRPPDFAHELYRRFAAIASVEATTPTRAERYWVGRAVAFGQMYPTALFELWTRKLVLFMVGPDGHDLRELQSAAESIDGAPLFRTEWLGALGLAALVWTIARRRQVALLAGYLACAAAAAVVFYVVSRYRVAAVPAASALVGVMVADALQLARERKPKAALALVAIVVALVSPRLFGFVNDVRRMLARARIAAPIGQQFEATRRKGQLAEARARLVPLLAVVPMTTLTRDLRGVPFEDPSVLAAAGSEAVRQYGLERGPDEFMVAVLAARAGRCEEAVAAFAEVAEEGFRSAIFDRALDPDLFAARCLGRMGRSDLALERVRASLEARPGTLDGLAAAVALAAPGSPEEQRWREALDALHDPLSAHYALAEAENDFDQASRALADARWVEARLPGIGVVAYEEARALAALGRPVEAARAYNRALAIFPRHAFRTDPLDEALHAALNQLPDDPELLSVASDHALRRGDLGAAMRLMAAANVRFAGAAPAWHRARRRYLAGLRP